MNKELVKYIETKIIPSYEKNDKAHNTGHIKKVIANSILIAEEYDVDKNIVYAAAAYHDLGLKVERERHEFFSKEIMLNDKNLDLFFNKEEKVLIADAILTHRASNKIEPKSIYGKIVADADRDLIPVNIIERTILFSLNKFPDYEKREHFSRSKDYIEDKYGEKGYINLWLDSEINNKNLEKIRNLIKDKTSFERVFDYYFNKHQNHSKYNI